MTTEYRKTGLTFFYFSPGENILVSLVVMANVIQNKRITVKERKRGNGGEEEGRRDSRN